MAIPRTVTLPVKVEVELATGMADAIRQIVRDEVANIAQSAAELEEDCGVDDCRIADTLATLAIEARAIWDESP